MQSFPKVGIVSSYLDAKGDTFEDLPGKKYEGIVTAGTGSGGLTADMTATRDKLLDKGIYFVTSTRTGSGTLRATKDEYLFLADSLNPYHARILLTLSIMFGGRNPGEVKKLFDKHKTIETESAGSIFSPRVV